MKDDTLGTSYACVLGRSMGKAVQAGAGGLYRFCRAAAAAIEQGDTKSASKFLSMALHEGLAYKSCRGVYELMTGNTYEGIRILKAAKAEGSEEAAYNLNVFFENNKRP